MDIEAIYSAIDACQYLELEHSFPFILDSASGPHIASFSYVLREEGNEVIAWLPEVLLLNVNAEGNSPYIEHVALDLRLPVCVPSHMGEMDDEVYAQELDTLSMDTSWDTMRELITRAEPEELIPLYDAVHNSLA